MLQCCLLHGVCCLWQRFLLCMPHGVCLCMLRSRTSSGARCLFCGSQDAWFHVACNMLQSGTLPVLPAATPHGCRMLAEGVAACRMLVCVLHGACFLVAAAAVWFGVSHPAGRRFDAAVACCLPHATWCVVRGACCVRSVARFTSLLRVACFPSARAASVQCRTLRGAALQRFRLHCCRFAPRCGFVCGGMVCFSAARFVWLQRSRWTA
jgi:hypothetical protein